MLSYLGPALPLASILLVFAAALLLPRAPLRQSAALLALLFLAPALDRAVTDMWDRPAGRNLKTMREQPP